MSKSRSMNELSVYVEEGDIAIRGHYDQDDPCTPPVVRVTPEQVDVLIA